MKSNILQSYILQVFWTQLLFQICLSQSAETCTNVTSSRNDCLNIQCQNGGRCVDGYNRYWCDCAAGYTYDGCMADSRIYYNGSSCEDVYQKQCAARATIVPCDGNGNPGGDGVYSLKYTGTPFRAFCVFSPIPGFPYTVIQTRSGCEIPFFRNWTEYETGFGDPSKDYWLGNDAINQITTANQRTVLRIRLLDWNGNWCYEEYDNFKIAGAQDKYRLLSVGNASGTCGKWYNSINQYNNHILETSLILSLNDGTKGDSLSYQVGSQFTTYDQDNDNAPYDNCAQKYQGAWWYNQCMHSNLNGLYVQGGNMMYNGICWLTGKGFGYSYKEATMWIKKA